MYYIILSVSSMEDIRSFENMLDRIKKLPSIKDAMLMTKTGMYILGSMRRYKNLEKFVGMIAILMGSAEAASLELKDTFKWVVIQTKSYKLAITNVDEGILLAVTISGKEGDLEVLKELERIMIPSKKI